MGEFPLKLFTEAEPLAVLDQFSQDVKQIGNEIDERYGWNKLIPHKKFQSASMQFELLFF